MSNIRDLFPKPVIMNTPAGIAVYPKLDEPDTKFKPEGEYKTGLRLTPDAANPLVEQIAKLADDAYEITKAWLEDEIANADNGKTKGKLKKQLDELKRADLPMRPEYDDEGEETGNLEFNFKMRASGKRANGKIYTQQPVVVDAKKKKMDPSIWGGSKIIVNFAMNAFYTPAVGVGVSLRLRGVQVLELRKGGASADSMFSEQDGYEAEDKGDTDGIAPEGSANADEVDDL